MTAAEIAVKIEGLLEGDGSVVIKGLSGLHDAVSGDITFLFNPRYASAVAETHASAVIVNNDWKGECRCAVIRVKNADRAFSKVASFFAPPQPDIQTGVHPTAVVAADVKLGDHVSIGPHCVLEAGVGVGDRTVFVAGCYVGHGARIGKDCKFHPLASLREGVIVGDRVIIHNGAVIGSDGFGYVNDGGKWTKIPQIGTVVIGDDVEIGANATIDRARFGATTIGNGVKIDNLVQIAHNVKVGDNTAMASQVGISGSTTIGKNVMLGGQAGLAGHLTVGDNAVVGAQGGVTKDVPPATFVSGYPAMPHDKAKKIHAHIMLLPALRERVKELEKRLAELEKDREESGVK
jgi:UDP-3-O-[3-hydroxymyristoyl] glucosamine N-acyltransferase